MAIRIVDLEGRVPSIPRLVVRCATAMYVGVIPFLGRLLSLIDLLLIFRDDKRCGHDLLAGTRVVKAIDAQSSVPSG